MNKTIDQENEFQTALKGKKVPVLVLDQKWHRLFAIHGKTDEIKVLEAKVSELLAKQGKVNQEWKELKRTKSQIMDTIVQNMDDKSGAQKESVREKKMEESKRLLDDINQKIDNCEDLLLQIPKDLKDTNEKLMLLSMNYFYEKIRINTDEAKEIEEWINQIRVELKKNIIRKQNREINNREIYSYLHDILGPEVLDLFDYEYEKEEKQE